MPQNADPPAELTFSEDGDWKDHVCFSFTKVCVLLSSQGSNVQLVVCMRAQTKAACCLDKKFTQLRQYFPTWAEANVCLLQPNKTSWRPTHWHKFTFNSSCLDSVMISSLFSDSKIQTGYYWDTADVTWVRTGKRNHFRANLVNWLGNKHDFGFILFRFCSQCICDVKLQVV